VLLRPHPGTPLASFAFYSITLMAVLAAPARRAISYRMSTNIRRGTATSAIWKVTQRPWLTTYAPILISFSRRLVSDRGSAVFGIASVRMKSPRL
jgi:hypothetical protein